MTRVCRKCSKTLPLHKFQRHDSGRRHVCRDCRTMQHNRWQMTLQGDDLKRFERNRARGTRRYLKRMKARRVAMHAERRDLLRRVVEALYRDGLTQKQLAHLSGVSTSTLRRITSTEPMEIGIRGTVGDKLLRFYSRWISKKKSQEARVTDTNMIQITGSD